MSHPLPGFLIVLSTFMHCGPPDGVFGCRWKCHGSSATPDTIDESRCPSDTPLARTASLLCGEKGDNFHQPEHVPRRCSYQTFTTNCTAPKWNAGVGQAGSLRHLTQCALPFVPSALDGGMGCSTFILKRVGQSWTPPLCSANAPQAHTHRRYPNACGSFHVKAQIRCLGGIAASRTGSGSLWCAVPRHDHSLPLTWSWSPWPRRACGKPSESTILTISRFRSAHESALLRLK